MAGAPAILPTPRLSPSSMTLAMSPMGVTRYRETRTLLAPSLETLTCHAAMAKLLHRAPSSSRRRPGCRAHRTTLHRGERFREIGKASEGQGESCKAAERHRPAGYVQGVEESQDWKGEHRVSSPGEGAQAP